MYFSKIGIKILATVLPVVFISTMAMGIIVYKASRSRIDLETEQKLFAVLDTEAAKVSAVLDKNADVAQAMVSYVRSVDKEAFTSGKFADFLLSIVPTGRNMIGGGIWFEPHYLGEGIKYFGPYVMREGTGHKLTFVYSTEEYDYHSTDWYKRGKSSDGPVVWEDIYYDWVLGITMITGTQPIFDREGKFIGVCTADMNDVEIRRVLREIRVGDTGRSFLLSSQGQFLVFRDPDKSPNMIITEDEDPSIAALGREIMQNDKGISSFRLDEVLYRVYYHTLPSVGWKLGIAIEENEISAPARTLTITMFYVTLATMAAIFLAVTLLAKHMHNIIWRINKFSALAAAGHLEERIYLDTGDEFVTIAENLNLMMENLGRLTRAKADFLSRMSHEIRTPINAIVGMADIGQSSSDRKQVSECLGNIKESSAHLIGIINDILDFSKVEAGKLGLDEAVFSLSEEMEFVTSMLAPQITAKDIDFILALREIEHDCITTDPLRLSQVVINLLSNAVKFTSSGGRISLEVVELSYKDGKGLYSFAVSDSGIGIAPEQVERMFNPFEQAGSHFGGTGLGLAISKSIVEMMGGKLEVRSMLGKGSSFSFSIQVQGRAGQDCKRGGGGAKQDVQAPHCADKRILIVDDMEMNRKISSEYLKKTGAALDTASNGREAVDMFMAAPVGYYDLILMDVQMPIMDGYEATRLIRESGRGDAGSIKIVAMTANALPEDAQRVLDAGMDKHLPKPVTMAAMFSLLTEIL